MKRLSKILMLVLVVALTLGCVFVIASSAADYPTGMDVQSNTTFETEGDTASSGAKSDGITDKNVGTLTLHQSNGGNHYADWTYYNPATTNSNLDPYMRLTDPDVRNSSYYIIEMDLATKTEFPNDWYFMFQGYSYDANYQKNAKGSSGGFTFFTIANHQITLSDGTVVKTNTESDWTHLTFVLQLNSKTSTAKLADGTETSYLDFSDGKINVYADGKFVSQVAIPANWYGQVYMARWGILRKSDGLKNGPANGNICWDNLTFTDIANTYEDGGDAHLAQLFITDLNGKFVDLSSYAGNEVKYNKNGYTYPENLGNAYVTRTNDKGTTTVGTYKTLAEAIAYVNNRTDSYTYNVYLLADEGIKVTTTTDGVDTTTYYGLPAANVNRGVKIHTNGHLFTEPTMGGIVTDVTKSGEGAEEVYTYNTTSEFTTFYYYLEGTVEDALNYDTFYESHMSVAAGKAPIAPVVENTYDSVNNLVVVFDGWKYYKIVRDEDGEPVSAVDLGDTCPEITADLYQQDIYAIAQYTKTAALFEVGGVKYTLASDFTAANLNGKTIKLLANITVTETLENVTIDLNGYNLTTAAILTTKGSYIYNSAATPATIYANNSLCSGGGKYNTINVGYSAVNVKATGRITIVASVPCIGNAALHNNINYHNVDFVVTTAVAGPTEAFLGKVRGTSNYYVENCNFYFYEVANIVHAEATTGTLTLKNCEVYFAKGGRIGAYNAPGSTHGQVTVVLEDTQIYGEITAPWTPEKYDYVIDASSILGSLPYVEGHAVLPEGYLALPTTATKSGDFTYKAADGKDVTFEPKDLSASYVVVVPPTANLITVYNKGYGDGGIGTTVNAYVDYIPPFPTVITYGDEENVSVHTGNYVLYNAAGVEVGKLAIGAPFTQALVEAGAVWAYPEVVIEKTAFVVITHDEENQEIGSFKAAGEFTAANVNNKFVRLISDVTVLETLSNATIDLNGCALIVNVQLSTSGCFIYNGDPDTCGTIYANAALFGAQKYANIKIGYTGGEQDENGNYVSLEQAEGRILLVATVNMLGGAAYGVSADYYNIDFVSSANGDWQSSLLGQLSGEGYFQAENCDFYFENSNSFVCCSSIGDVKLALIGCNVYFANGGFFTGKNYDEKTAIITLKDTHVYGKVDLSTTSEWYDYDIDDKSTFGGTPFAPGHAGEGNVLVPIDGATAETITFNYSVPAKDGNGYDAKTFSATLWSSAKMGTQAELNALYASFYRNVSLDVNINFNLYVPVTVGLVTVNGEVADTVKINGVDYYVVTYGQAAQNAYGDNWVKVNINGANYAYNASLVNYVTALNNVQSTDAYVVDSQKLAQYVVYYVKTAAMNAYADAVMPEAVNTILEGFELTADDKAVTGAIENIVSINGVAGATLELGNSVGMVVRITDDFVGTITVSMDGAETVSETYEAAETDEEKLGKRYIVISNIAAFDFTNNVVITNDKGETMTYNLATYVVNMLNDAEATDALKAVASATYAYAVQAKAYNDLYGAAKTVD